MTPPPQPFVFGYFQRHKYKDLVFYVETGEYSNMGLFEMEDTEENRALMDALSTQSSRDKVYESVFTITDNHLIECCNYDDDEVFCNYSGEQCRFTYRNRCKNYKSVIHHQVECDAIQGTHFAQQMVKDAELRSKAGEP